MYRPFFWVYGETFLEEMQEEGSCVGTWPFTSCGSSQSWLLPVILAIYLVITNTLLLNLLIAMFNSTVSETVFVFLLIDIL